MKGYIQVYTGNGKGKTTAAIGLAIRAVGAGKKVFIGQFVKGIPYSEIITLRRVLPEITVKLYGLDCFIYAKPTPNDIKAARTGLLEVAEIIVKSDYDVVILDEACIAVYYNLFSDEELIQILCKKNTEMEIVITGRYATPRLIEFADLVTDMNETKHYYRNGVLARDGIEY